MGEEIRIQSLIFHKNGTFIEVDTPFNEFFLRLSPKAGYTHFVAISQPRSDQLKHFELVAVLPANSPEPSPLVSNKGVLWYRQAAIEAEKSIFSFLQGLD